MKFKWTRIAIELYERTQLKKIRENGQTLPGKMEQPSKSRLKQVIFFFF